MISPSHPSSRSSSSEPVEHLQGSTAGHPPHIKDTRSSYALLSSVGGSASSGQPVGDDAVEVDSIFWVSPAIRARKKEK